MNMFARFDENPAMTLRVIKETKRYGRTDARTDNVKTVYPLQTKFAGGIKKNLLFLENTDTPMSTVFSENERNETLHFIRICTVF